MKTEFDRHILIVDDEPVTRYILSMWLRKAGFQILQAENGSEALEYLKGNADSPRVDLMLLDIQMPQVNGIDLIQTMKRKRMEIPIIIISGYRREDIEPHLIAWQVHDFLEKPVRPKDVLATVDRVLASPGELVAEKG